MFFYFIFSARSIASKGKSDVKESTDSSTTLEDDDKGNLLFTHLVLYNIIIFLILFLIINLLSTDFDFHHFAALYNQKSIAFWR